MPDSFPASACVLMTADTLGGVWHYSLELARSLGERGVEVAMATMGRALTSEQRAEALALPGLLLLESHFKLEWMDDPWEDVWRAGEWLLDIEEQLRPDFVHLNSFAHGSLQWRSPVLMVGHSCVLSWWRAVKGARAPAEWSRYAQEVREGLRGADVVTAPTCAMLEALEAHYGRLPVNVVVPNGRDPSRFPPGTKEPFVLTAGRFWDEAKNLRALDLVAPQISWPVYAAGSQAGFRNVEELGWQPGDAMAHWMGRAAIYALPARYEPFGLSILEAALAGCALVIGDLPSLRELWGDDAFYVDPDNPGMLQGALELLIEDDLLRRELAARSRSRALTFSTNRMTEGYLAAYDLAANLRKTRAHG